MSHNKYNAYSMWRRNIFPRRTTNLLLLPRRNVFRHSRRNIFCHMPQLRGRKILHHCRGNIYFDMPKLLRRNVFRDGRRHGMYEV